jgi:hypothetical protein
MYMNLQKYIFWILQSLYKKNKKKTENKGTIAYERMYEQQSKTE